MAEERARLIEEAELMSRIAGLSSGELEICLAAGWVVPVEAAGARRYLDVDVARLRLIHELRHDLALDDEAVPVVLQLIDQLHSLRHGLLRLRLALEHQPAPVRQAIAEALVHLPED